MNNYQNKINIDKILFNIKNNDFIILKYNEESFNYILGSDIDILCLNKELIGNEIKSIYEKFYKELGFILRVNSKSNFTHIDFLYNGKLHIKFDLIEKLSYRKFKIKHEYKFEVFHNKKAIKRTYKKQEYVVYKPGGIDELVIRYFEYIDKYSERPDKIKHISYILEEVSKDINKINFLNIIHQNINKNTKIDKIINTSFKIKTIVYKLNPIYYILVISNIFLFIIKNPKRFIYKIKQIIYKKIIDIKYNNLKLYSFDTGWSTINYKGLINIKLKDLYAVIVKDSKHVLVKLNEAPHYKSLINKSDDYKNYVSGKSSPYNEEKTVLIDKFKKLKQDIEKNGYDDNFPIIVRENILGKKIIYDGVHRASICLFNNINTIKCGIYYKDLG